MKPKNWLKKVRKGLEAAFQDWKKASLTISLSSLTFILLALSTNPTYSIQMLSAGFQYWIPAIELRILGIYLTGGITNILTIGLYALLTGIALTNFVTQLRTTGAQIRNLSGVLPGFIAAGCAGCGVGLLGFLGLTGALAALPFQGDLVRVAGLGLLVYFIGRTGDPTICTIPDE